MGRKEKRAFKRKLTHLMKTKPWELEAIARDSYNREIIENRLNNDVLAPGDKVMIDLEKMSHDPEWDKYKPEYKEFVMANANRVFTLRREIKEDGPFALVSFEEDETEPKWMFYLGHIKKVSNNED